MARPPRSVAAKSFSAPSSLPIGVRAPPTITEPIAQSPTPPSATRLFRAYPVRHRTAGTASAGSGHRSRNDRASTTSEWPYRIWTTAIALHTGALGLRLIQREDNPDHQVTEAMLAPDRPAGRPPDPAAGTAAECAGRSPLHPAGSSIARARAAASGVPGIRCRVRSARISQRHGLRLLYDSPRAGTRGSLINFVHPKDTGGVLLELVEAAESEQGLAVRATALRHARRSARRSGEVIASEFIGQHGARAVRRYGQRGRQLPHGPARATTGRQSTTTCERWRAASSSRVGTRASSSNR